MEYYLLILLGHYLADYPLQGTYLATTKGNIPYNMIAHSMIYALTLSVVLSLCGVFTLSKFGVILTSHILIDSIKCELNSNTDNELVQEFYLIVDQALHIGINLMMYWA